MKKNSIKRLILSLILTLILGYSFIGTKGEVVENLDIPIAIGSDLEKGEYASVILSVYEFNPDGSITSRILKSEGDNIAEARNDRQRKSNKKFLLGLEKLYVISDAYAQLGVNNVIDVLVNNPTVNDRSPAVVVKGKVVDLLKYKMEGYASSAEFIEGMIKNSIYNNFFSNQFSMMDLIVRVDAEGRNGVLPYVELKEEGPEITGLAIFKGDKMIGKTNIKEARTISLLKFDGGKGILTIQKDSKHYVDFYAESKRKVKCYKTDGKYNFIINIELNGTIASNELDTSIYKDPKELKKITSDIEDKVKKMCTEYINKAKYEYKTDIWELGRVAAAKYGRQTGMDWDKVISESNIEVRVKATVKDLGRGTY
ncbi:Ger(x)C family spore germination protein [Clostridium magnum]|uniref:Spore germination protein A3 n=1 Tax=Clostridium magnum DSM 2767 TaxID=1121326 RepID=A0A162R7Q5_9CLOT|nr:Ger(x)C family spore germination protein [Clostridium magnum]KZL89547.1 spore germination protein A3 precursor [Clostridium magnum DSM 2767]SHH71931.1 germination protein, Ger(x)C family [Clostridium magnum DSM 2767]